MNLAEAIVACSLACASTAFPAPATIAVTDFTAQGVSASEAAVITDQLRSHFQKNVSLPVSNPTSLRPGITPVHVNDLSFREISKVVS